MLDVNRFRYVNTNTNAIDWLRKSLHHECKAISIFFFLVFVIYLIHTKRNHMYKLGFSINFDWFVYSSFFLSSFCTKSFPSSVTLPIKCLFSRSFYESVRFFAIPFLLLLFILYNISPTVQIYSTSFIYTCTVYVLAFNLIFYFMPIVLFFYLQISVCCTVLLLVTHDFAPNDFSSWFLVVYFSLSLYSYSVNVLQTNFINK